MTTYDEIYDFEPTLEELAAIEAAPVSLDWDNE
jgi:hypothetical protein